MLWTKAFHIIFMVTWFAGLFYLPRLFVYHALTADRLSSERFEVMERKLYFGITTPGAVLTVLFGLWTLTYDLEHYLEAGWLHAKLALVACLIGYHVYLGRLLVLFRRHRNPHGHVFYRWLNEFPVLILVGVVLLAVVKPF
jgi:protoporphyrinogen IX oxidase